MKGSVLNNREAARSARTLLDRASRELVPATDLARAAEEIGQGITEGCDLVMGAARAAGPNPEAQRAMFNLGVMANVAAQLLYAAVCATDGRAFPGLTGGETMRVANNQLLGDLMDDARAPLGEWASLVRREIAQLKLDASMGIAGVGLDLQPKVRSPREHFLAAAEIALGCTAILAAGTALSAGALGPEEVLGEDYTPVAARFSQQRRTKRGQA